jgi:adenosylcobinamide amidohydrolase
MRRASQDGMAVRHRVVQNTLIIDLGASHRVLSSAPRGGGLITARSILNHQVVAAPFRQPGSSPGRHGRRATWSDPARYLGAVAVTLGARLPCVGLMTAVPMKRLVTVQEEVHGLSIRCFCTVGVTNAVKAGEPAHCSGAGQRCCPTGTINIILVTNVGLSIPAMVGAVQVATEAKTAVLLSRSIPSHSGRAGATGTGTDAVVVAAPLRAARRVYYSGTHTEVGALIGRVVTRAVERGLKRAERWNLVGPSAKD